MTAPSRSFNYRGITSLILDIIGILAVVAGVAMIYVPAGVIIGGLLTMAAALAIDPPKKAPKVGEAG